MGYSLRWSTEPLTGEIQSGDLIVVKLRLTGKKGGRALMIEDPIPSGAEQLEAVGNLNSTTSSKVGPTGTARVSFAIGGRCFSSIRSTAT